MNAPLPRGIRNCNPGNIRLGATVWQGQRPVQEDGSFVQFESMAYGIRALAKVLIAYRSIDRLNTLAEFINRWAPPADHNDTSAYLKAIMTDLGWASDRTLAVDTATLQNLAWAISHHENGGFYLTLTDIVEGVEMALA